MQIPFREFMEDINVIFSTPVCRQCRLGYADVMFLGFGEFLVPEKSESLKRDARPHLYTQYELKTDLCDWEVTQNGEPVGSSYDDPDAKTGAQMLVGKRLLRWTCLASAVALFDFDENITLTLTPYEDEKSQRDSAWYLRNASGWYTFICGNGKTYRVPHNTLLRDWTA